MLGGGERNASMNKHICVPIKLVFFVVVVGFFFFFYKNRLCAPNLAQGLYFANSCWKNPKRLEFQHNKLPHYTLPTSTNPAVT